MSRSPFDALVDAYDGARPSYPDGHWDVLEELCGPLPGMLVADVGAGTGIATRGLMARGAHVVAFDIGASMLARLIGWGSQPPGHLLGAILATGEALPVADRQVDLVTYAQAFHWVDSQRACAEARRVLRAHGSLALWWNDSLADGEPWYEHQLAALERGLPGFDRRYRQLDPTGGVAESGCFGSVATAETPWQRTLPIEDYLVFMASKSYVAQLGARRDEFLAAERRVLESAFPDGVVTERFVTRLWVAR